ncbi:MAG: DUF177 domain-containing protein [Bacteroidetes bacterium]|nr:DUF177 domain-containing protein [Bacteroidota bacterium]
MGKSQYIIQFAGLPVGIHEFEFDVTDKFFTSIESSEIQRANLHVLAILTKQNNLLQMSFEINGTVGVECDRCLKDFDFPVEAEEVLVIKHGNPDESTDEILVIPEGEDEFDVAQYIYEYIVLALPVRKVPCELDEESFKCDYETLEKLNSISSDAKKEEPINPLWEQLNKLKKNNKN